MKASIHHNTLDKSASSGRSSETSILLSPADFVQLRVVTSPQDSGMGDTRGVTINIGSKCEQLQRTFISS